MKLVVTGGIASGKTEFCRVLASHCKNVSFFSCDELVSKFLQDEEVLKKMDAIAHLEFRDINGFLSKDKLRQQIFTNPHLREQVEAILHPLVQKELLANKEKFTKLTNIDLFVVEIPLFFERNFAFDCDQVILVATKKSTQEKRLLKRWGKLSYLEDILNSQLPMKNKIPQADVVVWNEGSFQCLTGQVDCFLNKLCL